MTFIAVLMFFDLRYKVSTLSRYSNLQSFDLRSNV